MKNVFYIPLILILFAFVADKPAYTLFGANGKTSKYSKLIKQAKKADIIFFGELHTNPIAHWLQIELIKDLEKEGNHLVLGAEMFESDGQLILDEYLSGQISSKKFEAEMRLWSNYKTDYKPLVEFAKEKQVPFVATNIPRRYASKVFKQGFESLAQLSDQAKRYFAPLPMSYPDSLECYKKMLEMGAMSGHTMTNLPKAQAVKDATMAHFILANFVSGKTFVHFNGSYHSNNQEGIVWYIKQQKPELNVLTIATVEQDEVEQLEKKYLDSANFILCVPSSMTTTHR